MKEKASFRNRFREALDLRELRPVDFSEKTGIPKGAVSYYLAGRSEPKADRLHEIAMALDVNEAWLLGYDVDRERTVDQKKNDQLAELIVKMRREPDLFEAVQCLADLPAEQFENVRALLSALRK